MLLDILFVLLLVEVYPMAFKVPVCKSLKVLVQEYPEDYCQSWI